ncbi:MAG: hotdog domain-containing protein, partial [Actinomycetota bacterium]
PTRRWTGKAWICCVCAFKGRRREVMGYNGRNGGVGWTELFFLDEVTALATLGAAFEGPPGRAHGGVVSAVVDETMTALLTVLGTVAFASLLQVEYVGPTPLHVPLEFRARLTERTERNLTLTCTGQAGDTTFVRATGNFIEVDLRHLLAEMNHLVGD